MWIRVVDAQSNTSFNTFKQFAERPTNLLPADSGKKYLFTQTGNFHLWRGTTWQVLNESIINVKDYGAIGDGINDDTAPIQMAIHIHDSLKIKKVYIPAGNYVVSNIGLTSNVELYGDGWNTIIKRKFKVKVSIAGWSIPTVSRFPASDGVFSCGENDSPILTYNLTIRDLQMQDDVVNVGFDELMHLMNFRNCIKVNIERVKFSGFLGDGLCLGATNSYTQVQNRVEDIRVIDCYFDGINSDNRQAISFYNIDGGLVQQCYFTRCTRYDMPGAIDFEPDGADAIIRNTIIENNKFINIGTSTIRKPALVIATKLLTNQNRIANIEFNNNYCEDNSGIFILGVDIIAGVNQLTETSPSFNINITKNTFVRIGSISLNQIKGVNFGNNIVREMTGSIYLGYAGTNNTTDPPLIARETKIVNNTFEDCKNEIIYSVLAKNTTIKNNIFRNWGLDNPTNTSCILLSSDPETLLINENIFNSPSATSTVKSIITGFYNPKKIFYIANTTNNIPTLNLKCNNFNQIGYSNYQNAYTTNLLPDSYEIGEFTNTVNGDNGLPNSYYLGGTLKTIKTLEDINLRNFSVIQFFYQLSDDTNITNQDIYFRKAKSGSNAWGPWKKISYN